MPTNTCYVFTVGKGFEVLPESERERFSIHFESASKMYVDAIYYVQAPLLERKKDGVLFEIMIWDLRLISPFPDILPWCYLVTVKGFSDHPSDILVPDSLSLLELLSRYGSLITQPLKGSAYIDRSLWIAIQGE